MRHLPRALLAACLGFALAFLVACGGGAGLLTGSQSDALNGHLDSISSAVGGGDCVAAQRAVAALGSKVSDLPVTVNPTLRANLAEGVSTVAVLAARDCHATTQPATSTTTTTPTTTTTTTTTPTTTTTTTSTSTTTPTSTTTSTTTPSSTTTPATTSTTPGTTSTTGGTGGVGLGGGRGGAGNGNGL